MFALKSKVSISFTNQIDSKIKQKKNSSFHCVQHMIGQSFVVNFTMRIESCFVVGVASQGKRSPVNKKNWRKLLIQFAYFEMCVFKCFEFIIWWKYCMVVYNSNDFFLWRFFSFINNKNFFLFKPSECWKSHFRISPRFYLTLLHMPPYLTYLKFIIIFTHFYVLFALCFIVSSSERSYISENAIQRHFV